MHSSRNSQEWHDICGRITAGYTPGGRKEMTYTSGLILARILADLGVWRNDDTIVDVGSGNGRLAMGLYGSDYRGSYTGLEIIKPCVEFCQMAFSDIPNFRFIHVDVKNGHYWPIGAIEQAEVIYPVENDFADVVIAESVFSHTGTIEAARQIYGEMVRMCRPGGLIFSTWRFGEPDRDEAATNYRRQDVEDLFTGLLMEQPMPPASQAPRQVGLLCRKL